MRPSRGSADNRHPHKRSEIAIRLETVGRLRSGPALGGAVVSARLPENHGPEPVNNGTAVAYEAGEDGLAFVRQPASDRRDQRSNTRDGFDVLEIMAESMRTRPRAPARGWGRRTGSDRAKPSFPSCIRGFDSLHPLQQYQ